MDDPSKETAAYGSGVGSDHASDLRDTRKGTFDPGGNLPKANTSKTTPHERAQPAEAMQGEPIPDGSADAALPEGLKRERKEPYSRIKGRNPG